MVTTPYLPPTERATAWGDRVHREPAHFRYGHGWETNWDVRIIELGELYSAALGRDAIPALDAPSITSASAVTWLPPQAPVVVLHHNGETRIYPVEILLWHEAVNDEVGGQPVVVTYSPLTDHAAAYRRDPSPHATLVFGVSGMLRHANSVLYDAETESFWQQFNGKCIVGSYVGARLARLPVVTVPWQAAHRRFPHAQVVDRETGHLRHYGVTPHAGLDRGGGFPRVFFAVPDRRLAPLQRVLTVTLEDGTVAYPHDLLSERRVHHDTRGSDDVVLFWMPGMRSPLDQPQIERGRDIGAATAFYRAAVDGRLLTFRAHPTVPGAFQDDVTRSTWDIFGTATDGPLAGRALPPTVHGNPFWFAVGALDPHTAVVTRIVRGAA